jgi:hypothetical protein
VKLRDHHGDALGKLQEAMADYRGPIMAVSPQRRAQETFNLIFPGQPMQVIAMSSESLLKEWNGMKFDVKCPDIYQNLYSTSPDTCSNENFVRVATSEKASRPLRLCG